MFHTEKRSTMFIQFCPVSFSFQQQQQQQKLNDFSICRILPYWDAITAIDFSLLQEAK